MFGVLSVNSKLASFHKQRMEQFCRIFSFDVIIDLNLVLLEKEEINDKVSGKNSGIT